MELIAIQEALGHEQAWMAAQQRAERRLEGLI
jgi:hypothetical protein